MITDNTPAKSSTVSKSYSYYVFSLLILLYMFDYIDRMIVASLFPFIKADWNLTDAQCGLLVSAVYWSILIFSLPVSVFIDRWSRKNCIGIMAVIWSIATVSCAFTKNFTQLFATRAAIGVGEAGYAPGGTAMISALFPKSQRALALGIWTASIPLGSAIGIGLGGVVAHYWGWRHAFGLVALPGFVVAILFFGIKDYKSVDLVKTDKTSTDQNQPVKMSRKDIVLEFVKKPSLLLTFVAFAGNTFVTTSLLIWLPTYFHRVQKLEESSAGIKSSIIMVFAIVGAPLGGYLADKWQRKLENARLLFCSISSILTGIALLFAFGIVPELTSSLSGSFGSENTALVLQIGNYIQYGFLLITGILAAAFVPGAAAVTQELVHPGLRATSYSFCVIVQNLLGSSMGPIFVGAVSDHYNISTAMTILPIFSFLAGILFFIGSLFFVKDLNSVEKMEVEFNSN